MSLTTTALGLVHFVCGFVVLSEALNKLERTDIFDGAGIATRVRGMAWLLKPWAWNRPRVLIALKLLAWALLAVGAAGALVTPLVRLEAPTLQDAATMAGFAVLIVRSRLKDEIT